MADINIDTALLQTQIIFISVNSAGEIVHSNLSTDRFLESYKLTLTDILPVHHTEIVKKCLKSCNPIRNIEGKNGTFSVLWDYYPLTDIPGVHLYGMQAADPIQNENRIMYPNGQAEGVFLQYLYYAPDAMIVYDNTGRIFFSNLKCTTLAGYHYSELLGKSIEILFPPDLFEDIPFLYDQNNGSYTQLFERTLQQKNGDTVDVLCREQMLPGDRYEMVLYDTRLFRHHEEFYGAIRIEIYQKLFIKLRLFRHGEGMVVNLNRLALFLRNIDSLRKKAIFERFTAAAEEFKKFIYPEIQNIGRLIKATHYSPIPRYNTERTTLNGDVLINLSDRLKVILDGILPISGLTRDIHGFEIIKKHRHDLVAWIKEVKRVISGTTKAIERHFICPVHEITDFVIQKYASNDANVLIRLTDKPDDSVVIMNCSELGTVIEIIIKNAIEALKNHRNETPGSRPTINVSIKLNDNKVYIEIEDNGPGVPREYHSILFKDGFTTKGPGHGFGLCYAAMSVSQYGGRLFFEHRKDQGANFIIELLKAGAD
jgi:PAS domain S-box-containing protein